MVLKMKCLNLGCGTRFHTQWSNVDFISTCKGVIALDLRKGIPFQDSYFDVVYHSHLLEHFPKNAALPFMMECYRVLKPGGVIRVAIPDLERIASLYLQALEKASSGDEYWQHNYDWIMLEMYDQTVREYSGGEMGKYLEQETISNKQFVIDRIGIEGKKIIENAKTDRSFPMSLFSKRNIIIALRNPVMLKNFLIERIVCAIPGKKWRWLQVGMFRDSGEIHKWMYDRYSLSKLLIDAGFKNPCLFTAVDSQIPNWKNFNMDTEPDGTVYKPDSIYIEGIKTRN